MTLPNDYFFDTDKAMVDFLEEQAKTGIESMLSANRRLRDKAEKVMNYLLVGMGAVALLLFNKPELLEIAFAKTVAYTLLAGWSICTILLFVFVLKSSTHGVFGNAPDKLYNASFKQQDNPERKLLRLRQLNLNHKSRLFSELLIVNNRLSKWGDRLTLLAMLVPLLAVIFPYLIAD